MSAETDHLRALLDAGTPGPWEAHRSSHYVLDKSGRVLDKSGRIVLAAVLRDAELIAAAVNALPVLLDAVKVVEDLVQRWSVALDNGCPTCGPVDDCDHIEGYHHALSDLRAALAPLRGDS